MNIVKYITIIAYKNNESPTEYGNTIVNITRTLASAYCYQTFINDAKIYSR